LKQLLQPFRWGALDNLAKAISTAEAISAEQAAAVWHGLADVAKALRKAGHPKRERPVSVVMLAEAAEPATAVLPAASNAV